MTTPIADLLAAVPSLNDENEPFSYHVEGETIVGTWDIVKATSLYPAEVDHVDKSYRITVQLDPAKSTYDFSEHSSSTQAEAKPGGASFEKEFFSGKQTRKEVSFSFGGVNKTPEGVSTGPLAYSFSTSRIKEPLFGFLEQHGWKKKGLLARMFGR